MFKLCALIVILLATLALYGCIFQDSSDDPPLEPWEKHYKAAEKYFQNQQYDLAADGYLRYIHEIENRYPSDEKMREDSFGYYTASKYEQLSKIYVLKGKYHDAINARTRFYQLLVVARSI